MTDRWLSVEDIAAYSARAGTQEMRGSTSGICLLIELVDSGNFNPRKSTNGFNRGVQQIMNIGKENEGLGFRLFRSSLDTGRRDLM